MINKPRHRDAWERWWKSLEFLSKANTRTVVRITLMRSYNTNMQLVQDFAEMLKHGNPHFIEAKSYMHVGYSTQRLEQSDMMEMDEVRAFANGLAEQMGTFAFMDESIESRVVVLQNNERHLGRWIA